MLCAATLAGSLLFAGGTVCGLRFLAMSVGPTGASQAMIGAVASSVDEQPRAEARGEGQGDAALVQAVAAGDSGAVAALYDRYAGLLLAVARRMLGSQPEAEDLVHDVFVEAWRNASRYDPARATVRTWLLVRCRSRALDRLRAPRRSRATDLREVVEQASGADDDPARELERVRVRSRVLELAPQYRVLIEKAYFRGLSSREIAEQEGLPIGTVKSRIAAAMRALRAVMAGTDKGGTTGGISRGADRFGGQS